MTVVWDNGGASRARADGATAAAADDGEPVELPPRPLLGALVRGARGRCPACGEGRLFAGYLAVAHTCGHCGEALHHQRADDAPPYFSTFVVGHVVVGLVLSVELWYAPPLWVHAALWVPLTIALVLVSLPPIKGVLVGQQWALHMHGFAGETLARLARESDPVSADRPRPGDRPGPAPREAGDAG